MSPKHIVTEWNKRQKTSLNQRKLEYRSSFVFHSRSPQENKEIRNNFHIFTSQSTPPSTALLSFPHPLCISTHGCSVPQYSSSTEARPRTAAHSARL